MRPLAVLALCLSVALAGCGGGAEPYALDKTRSCLVGKQVRIGGTNDFVAVTAPGGAFVARFGDGNRVTVSFGETDEDAANTEEGYRRAAFANVRAGLDDILKRDRNVVMLWHEHPSSDDDSLLRGCLR